MQSIVFIEKLEHEREANINQFFRAFDILAIPDDFNKANAIFIKPNLTYPVYKQGVTTRPEFVNALVKTLRQINSTTKIYIGEGEGGYNSFSMTKAMYDMGFNEMERLYKNVKIVNLSELPRKTMEFEVEGKPYFIELPEFFDTEIDFSISCPLAKIHDMTRVTLSFKNQWGCLPDIMRLKNHYVFDEIISQIANRLKFRYAFLDGKYGLDKGGPITGDLVDLQWFVASNSLGAFDLIISEMMGIDWKEVRYLVEAKKRGIAPDRDQIQIIGNINDFYRQFTLKRTFWAYPALIAFGSRQLTQLVYLSRFSKLIHDIMYLFRKREM